MAIASPIPASLARTVIAHNRLEPRPRSTEFNRSLRAEVRDAAWLLARQWQLGEFRAEDRGSPAFAELSARTAQPNRIQLGDHPAQDYAPATPWEAQLQAEPPLVEPGLRLRMGQAWLRLLRAQGLGQFAGAFRTRYPLLAVPLPAEGAYDVAFAQAQTTEVQVILRTAGAQALDGYALFEALRADRNAASIVVAQPISETTRATLAQAATNYVATYGRLYFDRPAASAWSVPELAYDYALAVPDESAAVVLAGQTPAGNGLHWHSVDEAAAATYPALSSGATGSAVEVPSIRFIPTEIEFIGSPASRWWDFEDHRVDLGQVTGDSSDFGRMLLQEFAFLYQNDWFSVPYTVPVGSLSTVTEMVVTDVFGQSYRVHPAGASPATEPEDPGRKLDDDAGRWGLFRQSPAQERTAPVPRLLIPHAALTPLVGRPVEQVTLLREEATNLVWAVEQTIPDGFGNGMDGAGAAAQVAEYLRTRATPPVATTTAYTYQLASSVAEHWIPFVPRPAATGLSYLEQGEIPRQVAGLTLRAADQTIQPRTPLLRQGADQPYLIHEYRVPPTGVRVEGAYRRARGLDGSVALWYGYQRLPTKPAGGSGLQFDTLLPPGGTPTAPPASPVAANPVQVMPYEQNQLFNLNRYHQYLSVPLPALPVLTVAFWVNVADEAFIGNWRYLLDARNLRDNTWFASLGIGSDWTWYLDGTLNTSMQLSGALSLNTWHHIVLTSGGATQAGDLLLNARYTLNEYTSPVRYADLRIYNRALLASEIADPTGNWSSSGQVARLSLMAGPRITPTTVQATDTSGNGNHGILEGF